MKEIKFKIIGQCPYTSRYFVQIIYQKEGVYAKITDFYKSIGTAKEITTEKWDGNGDISQVDLERFTAAAWLSLLPPLLHSTAAGVLHVSYETTQTQ